MNRQFCVLPPLGARIAASRMRACTSSGIGSGRQRRIARRGVQGFVDVHGAEHPTSPGSSWAAGDAGSVGSPDCSKPRRRHATERHRPARSGPVHPRCAARVVHVPAQRGTGLLPPGARWPRLLGDHETRRRHHRRPRRRDVLVRPEARRRRAAGRPSRGLSVRAGRQPHAHDGCARAHAVPQAREPRVHAAPDAHDRAAHP